MSDPLRTQALPSDDDFHAFDAAEWWSIETLWFAFTVPERALNIVVYLIIRPAAEICALQVTIFDPSGKFAWDSRHSRQLWHLPLPPSLTNFTLPGTGFAFRVIEPLMRYGLVYESENVALDVEWAASIPPRLEGGNHIDQFGRVRGEILLDGERIEVDCLQMRDRSWKRRSDLEGVQGAYSYAISSPWHALLMGSARVADECVAVGGWHLQDGVFAEIDNGIRRVLRRGSDGEPLTVELNGTDRLGRAFRAQGESRSRSMMNTSGNIQAWDSLVAWQLDGAACWGEDQDVWTPQSWREFRSR